ncbi:MAG: phosphatase PAP2 family protein [Deltaproteobacteria bacterium]
MQTDKNLYQHTAETVLIPLDRRDKSARIISHLLSPPLIALASIIITAQVTENNSALLWIFIFIGLLVLPPTLYVLWLVHRGIVSDFHLNNREERAFPLLVILANTALVSLAMYVSGAPRLMLIATAAALIQLIFVLIITLRWKISGHCTAAASLSVLAVALYGESLIPLTLIIPLTAWSRIRLGRHTFTQTVAGGFLGAVTVVVILYTTSAI